MKQMSNLSSDQTPSHIASSKEKIDAIFGITGGKSVDDFLDELSLDTNKIQQTMANIDSTVKDAIDGIDSQMSILTNSTNDQTSILSMKDMELSLKEIEEMVQLSKQIFKHISDSILATDLIDSELVHSAAVLMEGIHINISEFVSLYKSKQNFIDKVKFSILQQQQKKELLQFKHDLDMQKLKTKDPDQVVDVTGESKVFRQEDIINALKDID